ncbi:hypothetical protein D9O36_21065 [Zobellia amurskyensis]|uniref:Uncharacterized protein n=1 Tax=Zobellia amurskyensis TaxID=248905 RepID=A0A7X3D4K7_9FLAO|nr:hypothetical protein [Zobellia amurskyensis]MUH38343.1 hypothetical protein [Zobellia amurskyensis]
MKPKLLSTAPFLSVVLFFWGILFAQAQTYYALQIDRNIRVKAEDITAEYQPRLVMGTEQALEFRNTVAKYIIKKMSVENNPDITKGQRRYRLKLISSHESSEMGNVLYPYQWQEYLRIKPRIQPLSYEESGFDDAIVDYQSTN